MSKRVLGLIGGLALAWIILFSWNSWVNTHRIIEDPGNESSLYRAYDPEPVIKQFRYEHVSYDKGHSQESSHLVKSIHHSQDFTSSFTMPANQERELLNALRKDIVLRLSAPGMIVVSTGEETDGGFMYKYMSQNSRGSISVKAPAHQPTMRRYPVPRGLDDIGLKIALDETWTRPASETRWWMSAVD